MVRSFQWRITLLLIGLVAVVQFPTFLAVNYAIQRNVLERADRELDLGVKVFSRLLASRGTQLRDTVQVAAGDFAFREAAATGDEETLHSVLVNHGGRISASFALMVSLDGKVLSSTTDMIRSGTPFPFAQMLGHIGGANTVSDVAAIGDRPFQIVVAEVRAPQRIGWVSMGFELDQAAAEEFRSLSGLEVSVAVLDGESRRVYSTLPPPALQNLQAGLKSRGGAGSGAGLDQAGYLSRVLSLGSGGETPVWAILQSSSAQALQPYGVLKNHLVLISLLSLLLSAVGAWLLARGVTHPVRTLVAAARRIGRGDYLAPVEVDRHDELGELARVFNHMQHGIAQRENQIAHQAFHDALTGLPNRASIEEHLSTSIARAGEAGSRVAVLMLDVNRFKEINDTLGHPTGDRLLISLGQRLCATVGQGGVVARLGGDEFLIVLGDIDAGMADRHAQNLVQAATESMHLDSMDLYPDVSIGIAVYPEHGANAADLIRRADIAMYDAKQARHAIATYHEGRDATYLRRFSLINELRRAVSNDELRIHYQPKVAIGEFCPTHVEALIRWQHPVEGLLPPDEFIPLAEHAGSIHLLTHWMLRNVIKQCREWADAGFDLGVAVNLSAMDLAIGTLPDVINGYLDEFGVPPNRLLLEITESAIMRDASYALDVLSRLKACGVHLAIDDFGTGYSSLAHLKRLPVDEIKIDKSFVMSMTHDADDAIIVRSTIELGHNMGLSVVAEGVEDELALSMLTQYRCDMAQGYLISKPLPARELTAWLIDRCERSPLPHRHRYAAVGA